MKPIDVMLVDDSSAVRGFLRRILESDPGVQVVASAGNGEAALTQLDRHKPDIILLDLEMPVMDGLTAIPLILQKQPSAKILVCSAISQKGAEATLRALGLGAADFITKPSSSSELNNSTAFSDRLIELVHALQRNVKPPPVAEPSGASCDAVAAAPAVSVAAASQEAPLAVAIGSSTGGPQALFQVLEHLRGINVPVFITQHMPEPFTTELARQIARKSGMACCEADDGLAVEAGKIYLARGGHHMRIREEGGRIVLGLDDGPQENFCRPSVEPMMRDLLQVYGPRVLGVMLTGMGNDGLAGFNALHRAGGTVIIQDKDSSVVWGMPGAVADAGCYSKILPIGQIGPVILDCLK